MITGGGREVIGGGVTGDGVGRSLHTHIVNLSSIVEGDGTGNPIPSSRSSVDYKYHHIAYF